MKNRNELTATNIFHTYSGLNFKIFFKGTHTVNHVEFLTATHTAAEVPFDLLLFTVIF